MSIQRYECLGITDKCNNGDHVLYTDHLADIEAKANENTDLGMQIYKLRQDLAQVTRERAEEALLSVYAHYSVIHQSILDVIAATSAYLPPDGISDQECLNRILQATDNAEVVKALNELERNPYKLESHSLAAAAQEAESDHSGDVTEMVSERERLLESALLRCQRLADDGVDDPAGPYNVLAQISNTVEAALSPQPGGTGLSPYIPEPWGGPEGEE